MIVKTKKYALDKKAYRRAGMRNILGEQWWVGLIVLAISSMAFVLPSNWWWIGALIAFSLYLLFWLIQFAGGTQLEQSKMLFEKLSYEIDSRQILI
jgi:membrane protein YdbS with pleckstrin-like domain